MEQQENVLKKRERENACAEVQEFKCVHDGAFLAVSIHLWLNDDVMISHMTGFVEILSHRCCQIGKWGKGRCMI